MPSRADRAPSTTAQPLPSHCPATAQPLPLPTFTRVALTYYVPTEASRGHGALPPPPPLLPCPLPPAPLLLLLLLQQQHPELRPDGHPHGR